MGFVVLLYVFKQCILFSLLIKGVVLKKELFLLLKYTKRRSVRFSSESKTKNRL